MFWCGLLAQLVEHPTFNRTVVSSNLTEPTKTSPLEFIAKFVLLCR